MAWAPKLGIVPPKFSGESKLDGPAGSSASIIPDDLCLMAAWLSLGSRVDERKVGSPSMVMVAPLSLVLLPHFALPV